MNIWFQDEYLRKVQKSFTKSRLLWRVLLNLMRVPVTVVANGHGPRPTEAAALCCAGRQPATYVQCQVPCTSWQAPEKLHLWIIIGQIRSAGSTAARHWRCWCAACRRRPGTWVLQITNNKWRVDGISSQIRLKSPCLHDHEHQKSHLHLLTTH